MTTGFVAPAGDLDVLFRARSSAKIADVGFLSNGGVDISNRFEGRAGTTARPDTGFKQGANDLSSLFMDIDTALITLSDVTIESDVVSPTNPSVAYALENDGDIMRTIQVSNVDIGDWIVPKAAAPGAYECRATLSSGTAPNGGAALATWLPLTTTRFWAQSRNTNGTTTTVLLIEIRLGVTTVGSCTVTLRCIRGL
jgi:hypothetical protein